MRVGMTAISGLLGASIVLCVSPDSPRARQSQSSQSAEAFEKYWRALPKLEFPPPASGVKAAVVIFVDYQCPSCFGIIERLKPVLAKYQQTKPLVVTVLKRDYPLDAHCNPHIGRQVHASACDAAVLMRLARSRGKGDEAEAWLEREVADLTRAKIALMAGQVLHVDFDQLYESELPAIRADVEDAWRFGVRATPTVFVNGIGSMNLTDPTVFDLAIQYELAHSRANTANGRGTPREDDRLLSR